MVGRQAGSSAIIKQKMNAQVQSNNGAAWIPFPPNFRLRPHRLLGPIVAIKVQIVRIPPVSRNRRQVA